MAVLGGFFVCVFLNDEKRYGLRVERTELEPNGSESKCNRRAISVTLLLMLCELHQLLHDAKHASD